jgi:hypothetical protein
MADSDFPSDYELQALRQERVVDEYRRREELEAEVATLLADRAALLDLWIVENNGGWQVRSEAVPPPSFATREEAESAVLEWARGRKR